MNLTEYIAIAAVLVAALTYYRDSIKSAIDGSSNKLKVDSNQDSEIKVLSSRIDNVEKEMKKLEERFGVSISSLKAYMEDSNSSIRKAMLNITNAIQSLTNKANEADTNLKLIKNDFDNLIVRIEKMREMDANKIDEMHKIILDRNAKI